MKKDISKQLKKLPDSEIVFYQSQDGLSHIEMLFAEENIWLSQKKMAELFGTTRPNITMHLRNIFNEGELDEKSVCKDFLHTAADGKNHETKMYSLEAIVAVGYGVNSERGREFRQWATEILKSYIYKGYALDSDRIGNMYLDYAEMQAARGIV